MALLNPSDLIPGWLLEYIPDGSRWTIQDRAQAFFKGGQDIILITSIQEVGYRWVEYEALDESQWRLL